MNHPASQLGQADGAWNLSEPWQSETDEEEWSAWVDAGEDSHLATTWSEDEWLTVHESAEPPAFSYVRRLSSITHDPEARTGSIAMTSKIDHETQAYGKSHIDLLHLPNIHGSMTHEANEVSPYSNPWHEDDSPVGSVHLISNIDPQQRTEDEEAYSQWEEDDISTPPVFPSDEVYASERGPWEQCSQSFDEQEIHSNEQRNDDPGVVYTTMSHGRLTRDETQRRLVI